MVECSASTLQFEKKILRRNSKFWILKNEHCPNAYLADSKLLLVTTSVFDEIHLTDLHFRNDESNFLEISQSESFFESNFRLKISNFKQAKSETNESST